MSRYRSHSDTALITMQHALDDRDIAFRVEKRDIVCTDPEADALAEDLGLTKVKDLKHGRR